MKKDGRVKFRVHWQFIAVVIIFAAIDPSRYTAYVLLSAALHEAGHIAAALCVGAGIRAIELRPFGVRLTLREEQRSYADDVTVAAAGPAANLLAALVCVQIYRLFPAFADVHFVVTCNLFTCALNLLPVLPLDGGRILRGLLLSKLELTTAERVCGIVGLVFLLALFAAGIWVLQITGYNFSLILVFIYLSLQFMTT